MKFLANCIFGENCELCKYLDYEEMCFCWLVLVLGLITVILLVIIIFLISEKIKRNKMEEEIETANYIRTYNELAKKKEEDERKQKEYEAKMNGDEGCEDILVELVKEISEEEKINLDEIQFEAATSKDIINQEFSVEFQKQKEKDSE